MTATMTALLKVTVDELKPGELDVVDCSDAVHLYRCGHSGPVSFCLTMGDYDLCSDKIEQDTMCPECARAHRCQHLVRCPTCNRIYEVVADDQIQGSVPQSSLRHFLACTPPFAVVAIV